MEESAADKYLRSRDLFRRRARDEFFSRTPGARRLVDAANELVAGLTLFISERDLRGITHGFYIGDLIVSFCRSHFIASDLLLQSELIDAATLLRKPMELVGRLHELRSGGPDVQASLTITHFPDELSEHEYFDGLTEADNGRPERLRSYYEARLIAATTAMQEAEPSG